MSEEMKLKIIPLGGVDEIGKNMTVFEYGDDIVVVDCGLIFPQEDMLGIDLVIPDISYLEKNYDRVRAFLITHGHEDHIGATPYVLERIPVPVYGTKLTLGLVEHKLKERKVGNIELNVVEPGDVVQLGAFTVQFIRVSHSIAGAVAMAITTPVGTVLHTGDFKIDYTPVDGEGTDLSTIAALGSKGLLALLADSTNVERPGFTMTEKNIGKTFRELFRDAQGRIIIATFASNVSRIQLIVNEGVRYGRKFCFIGRSMVNIVKLAGQLGELTIPEDALIDIDDLDRYRDDQIVIVTTGSQGESMSGLMRMAYGEHRKVTIRSTDLVILSSSVIPGNEKLVSRVINQLYRCGATVIYEAQQMAEVHVSGHARQEELKLIHKLAHPRYFIPVHGEYRHLCQHAKLAVAMGVEPDHVVVPDLGSVIELDQKEIKVTGTVPSGSVLIDGLGVGDVGNVVLRDRKHLGEDGLMVIAVTLSDKGEILAGPDIISRGFVYVRDSEDMLEATKKVVADALLSSVSENKRDWQNLKTKIRDAAGDYLYGLTQRKPMILPLIEEVKIN